MDEEVKEHEVVDAEVVEETATHPKGTAVTVRNEASVIAPLAVEEVVSSMEAYQEMLPRLLQDSDYQDAGRGKRFVKKSGWRKIAKAFGLSTEIISQRIERDPEGEPLRATVIVRALHGPTGQHSDGDGHCSADESRFSGPQGNRSKIENDLTATATTRAKNRAISDLVGMGDVSAEEEAASVGPPYGPEATADQKKAASAAFSQLLGPQAEDVWGEVKSICGGYMPEVVAKAVSAIDDARAIAEAAAEGKGDG
jgi:hypothetical protein